MLCSIWHTLNHTHTIEKYLGFQSTDSFDFTTQISMWLGCDPNLISSVQVLHYISNGNCDVYIFLGRPDELLIYTLPPTKHIYENNNYKYTKYYALISISKDSVLLKNAYKRILYTVS